MKNNKTRKDFELVLPNSPLVSNSLLERLESLGLDLSSDQIDVLALALSLPADETLGLTAIRSLGTSSTREARELADQLIAKQVLELVGTSHFRISDQIRAGITPEVTPEVTPELARMLSVMTGEMSRAEIMAALGLRDEKHFRENYQQYGINEGLIEMTLPDTPRSRKQRYRLTDLGKALRVSTKGQD